VVWNLAAPPLLATAGDCTADEAWQKLASVDYFQRAQAFSFYLRAPAPVAAAELARHLNEHGAEAAERLRGQLAAQLDDNLPGLRLQAYVKLKEMGAAARPQLAAAIGHPSLEVRAQAAALLKEIGGPLDTRLIAAIQILGALNTPEAHAELAKIAAAGVQPYAAQARGAGN
jgi:HEAT repeat protein